MSKVFHKKRKSSIRDSKFMRYLLYAIGEIILVVIGILIALQVNNWNQNRIEDKERTKLVKSLSDELSKNLEVFRNRRKYINHCQEKALKIMAISAGKTIDLPMDSIRNYAIEMLPMLPITISTSNLTASKQSGRLNLLNQEQSAALAKYESTLESYYRAKDLTRIAFNTVGDEFMLQFKAYEKFHSTNNTGIDFPYHPNLSLTDTEFIEYLQRLETYDGLHELYTNLFTEAWWVGPLENQV
ncbi:MAG: DUF6090 family protein, partial [Flavobacteriaceae bacterium]|nr:DUF6090 family protein [Flavobacteriaceae bacterium]